MTSTLLINARIHTMDPACPKAEALLIQGETIAGLGKAEALAARAPKAKVIDAKGALVLPGFQDAHIHLLSGGTDLASAAPLYEASSLEDLCQIMRAHAAAHPQLPVIIGAGWQPGLFGDHNLSAGLLDPVTGARPAVLYDSSYHSACLNSAALAQAGISQGTPDPPQGHILRDAKGEPTGMLHEEAIDFAIARLPGLSDEDRYAGLMAGQAHANRHGLTGVLDPSVTQTELRLYTRALRENRLTLRVAGAAKVTAQEAPAAALARLTAWRAACPGPDLHLHSVKVFVDGVFENRTAACHAPYADAQGGNAPCLFSQTELTTLFTAFDAAGFQIHAHVIGDAATSRTLDALEEARRANGTWPGLHQLAHLQLVAPEDFARIGRLAMANIQPLWARFDPKIPDLALDQIGAARLAYTYAFRRLLDHGANYCLSSDWPVSSLNPFEIIETAVTRQARREDAPGPPFLPKEALTIGECLAGYTLHAARACWRAGFTGCLRPGFSADLILLDQDPYHCPADQISKTRVLQTLFKGRTVFEA